MRQISAAFLALLLFVPNAQAMAVRAAPAGRVPLSGLSYGFSPAQITDLSRGAGQSLTLELNRIAALPVEQRTFATTVRAMETAFAAYQETLMPIGFLSAVSPDAEVRAAALKADTDADNLMVDLGQNEALYQAVMDAAAKGEALSDDDARLLETTLRGFKHSGLGLSAMDRARLASAERRLTELASKFGKNLREADLTIDAAEADLTGLPASVVAGFENSAPGRKKIRLDAPTYALVMEKADNAEVRKAAYLKHGNSVAQINTPLLKEALELRHQNAKLLGYNNYAEMALSSRMAKTPAAVWSFLNRLRDSLIDKRKAEKDALKAFAKSEGHKGKLQPWDAAWYEARMKKAALGYDSEEAREHFPLEPVMAKVLRMYENLFKVRIEEIPAEAWHEGVRQFRILDGETGLNLGRFYADMFPRPGKYQHMAAFTIVKGRQLEDGGYREPVSALVGNFTPATGGRPALLRPAEVKTLFHELGHIMHQVLTTAPNWSQSGTAVARDFVEAPSQMMESFVWRPETLVELSEHFSDPSRKLSLETGRRIIADKFFTPASDILGQVAMSAFDLALHSGAGMNIGRVYQRIMNQYMGGKRTKLTTNFASRFGHIMGGYQAGYYGYLWSRVFALDAFSVFEAAGVWSTEVGMKWRRSVLEQGSRRGEDESLREFLGREPSEEAFLRWLTGGDEGRGAS